MVTELNNATFDNFVKDNKIAVIDCWAPWCGPCVRMTPIMEQLSTELAGKVGVAKLNVDKNQAISVRFGIRAIPTLLIFKDGALVETLVGLRGKDDILEYIKMV
jgi:thioredoxin 1